MNGEGGLFFTFVVGKERKSYRKIEKGAIKKMN